MNVPIDTADSGDTVLIEGSPGKSIRVFGYVFQCAGETEVTFRSGATPLTGALPNDTNTGVSSGYSRDGVFLTEPGDDLVLNNSEAVQVSGHLSCAVIG